RIYVAGATTSIDFPAVGPPQTAPGGGTDVFAAALSPDGSALVFSTRLGGSGDEAATRLALSESGPVLAGTTTSPDFPTRGEGGAGPLQASYGGGPSDAFLVMLSDEGSIRNATYLGGAGKDELYGLALSPGAVWLAGSTDSADFPLAEPVQPSLSFPPEADAFLTMIDSAAGSLVFSTYLETGASASCSSVPAKGGRPCGSLAVNHRGDAFV